MVSPRDLKAAPDRSRRLRSEHGVLRRYRVARRLSAIFDVTLAPLAVVTLLLLAVELFVSLRPPWGTVVYWMQVVIWGIFLAAFGLEVSQAPDRPRYIRKNLLLVIALLVPALRILRAAQAVRVLRTGRVVRGLNVARTGASLNRGLKAIQEFLGFSQIALVAALAIIVWLIGAGLVSYLEQATGSGLGSISHALWWSASVLTTVGISSEPESLEGRTVAIGLRLFGVAVVGYVTARLAAYILGSKRASESSNEMRLLREEIAALRNELHDDRASSEADPPNRRQDRRAG